MAKHVSKIHAYMVNPVILPEIVQIPVALAIFVNCQDMVKGNLDLVLDLKGMIILMSTMVMRITLLDIKEDLFIENLVVDLKDVDKGDLVANRKENEAIFEMTSTLQAIITKQFWKMYV